MQPWQTLASRPLLDRHPWLTVWEEDVRLPDGTVIRGYLRTLARDYSMIFALLPDGTVPLVCQYKHGPERASRDLPAGYLDGPDESPLTAAQRELREETGLVAERWQPLGHLIIDTNRGDTRAHVYLALDVRHEGEQELDPTEELEVSYHRPEDLRAMVLRGEIDSIASVAGIMLALDALRS
jgi:8-oxo-dGTP pyrophosphatase MutT (NUDIX family)